MRYTILYLPIMLLVTSCFQGSLHPHEFYEDYRKVYTPQRAKFKPDLYWDRALECEKKIYIASYSKNKIIVDTSSLRYTPMYKYTFLFHKKVYIKQKFIIENYSHRIFTEPLFYECLNTTFRNYNYSPIYDSVRDCTVLTNDSKKTLIPLPFELVVDSSLQKKLSGRFVFAHVRINKNKKAKIVSKPIIDTMDVSFKTNLMLYKYTKKTIKNIKFILCDSNNVICNDILLHFEIK